MFRRQRRNARSGQAGITLIEMLVASTIFLLLAAAIYAVFSSALKLRERALKPLHAEQVRLLGAWRREPSDDKLQALLLTVNAIAMGQKMTG